MGKSIDATLIDEAKCSATGENNTDVQNVRVRIWSNPFRCICRSRWQIIGGMLTFSNFTY